MKTLNPTSIGRMDIWGMVALEASKDRRQWRKVARFVNKFRRTRFAFTLDPNRCAEAMAYARKAFWAYGFNPTIAFYVRRAMAAEFNFDVKGS
jgi:hypothetical protein